MRAQTGTPVPELAAFDQAMISVMSEFDVPGGALAITKNGKLLFARGYGYADTAAHIPVQPDAMFRIASLSKPLTVAAVLTLVEDGKLKLDDHAFSILSDIAPPPGVTPDPRLKSITIRQLLQHSGGWDFNISADPAFIPGAIAKSLGKQAPATSRDMVQYMMGRPLDFDPGSRFAYSNFGYTVLGRVIEHVSGMNYEQFVRTRILLPAGVNAMRVGNTLPEGQLPREVRYYDTTDPLVTSVFPFISQQVAMPYGGWYLESLDSNAGWVASAIDYIKFVNTLEGRRGAPLLHSDSIRTMTAEPSTWTNADHWYGMGFNITTTPQQGAYDWWTDGVLEGTYSQVVRTYDGADWVVFFNKWPNDDARFGEAVNQSLWGAYDSISNWPTADQFTSWPDATSPIPSITAAEGVLSAASFERGIVSGSWIAIFGDNLAKNTRPWAASDFKGSNLPTSLDGVTVSVGGKPAPVYYISPKQINVQVPADLPAGPVLVAVTVNGVTSTPVVAELRRAAPAFFSFGPGLVAAVHLDGTVVGDPALVPGTRPAKPGETIMLFGTGFANSPAGVLIGTPQATVNPLVRIGSSSAQVQYSGLVTPGLFQINMVVPAVKTGSYSLQSTLGDTPFLGSASLAVGN